MATRPGGPAEIDGADALTGSMARLAVGDASALDSTPAREPAPPHGEGIAGDAPIARPSRRVARRVAAGILLVAVAAGLAWSLRGLATSVAPPVTALVARRDLSATVVATGTVKAVVGAEVKVGARVPGRVEQLGVRIGDRVTAGQVIARVEQEELRASVDRARAALAAAEARGAQAAQDLDVLKETVATSITREDARLSAARARQKLVVDGARPEEIAQSEAALRQAEATHQLATASAGRTRTLHQSELVARQDLDVAVRELDVASAQVRAAREQVTLTRNRFRPEEIQIARDEVRQAGAGLAQARAEAGKVGAAEQALRAVRGQVDEARAALRIADANLGYATITAPIGGVVASVSTQQGETVVSGAAAAQAPTFVTIIDLARMEVHAYVDETDIGKVTRGQAVTFTVDAFPDREFSGTVTAIYPKALIQLNVVTYDVVVAIDNRDGLLRPDMTANVTITVARRDRALAIPNAAVRRDDGERYALVQAGERIVRRVITTGWRDRTYTEVLSGLKEAERVVVGDAGKTSAATSGATPAPGAR